MSLAFHADLDYPDSLCRRLSFLDRDDDSSEHYLIFDRMEGSVDAHPDMGDIYLERDDQGWGGFGGIESVRLARRDLTFHLNPEMARKMGDHETLQVTFDVADDQWSNIRPVVSLIMKGYESRLIIED